MYGSGSPARKPPRTPDSGSSTPSSETELLPEARIPSASQSSWTTTPGASVGHHRVRVALGAVAVGVGDGDVEIGGGGRHRAEHLAAVDPPAGLGAGGERARPREVLAALADRGGQHDAVAGDLLERGGERRGRGAPSPAATATCAAALHVEHRDEVHVHADRDRGVAARQAARGDDQVVRGGDAEPAELDGDRARRSSRRP